MNNLIRAFEKLGEDLMTLFSKDETRTYNCYGLPVDLTLPEGEHPYIGVDYIAGWMYNVDPWRDIIGGDPHEN
jgi:hypothetical protein